MKEKKQIWYCYSVWISDPNSKAIGGYGYFPKLYLPWVVNHAQQCCTEVVCVDLEVEMLKFQNS